jgi:anti-sigma factor RsiW
MSPTSLERETLHAYHDGELGALARWRTRRRLARDPSARAELARLAELRGLVRELAAEPPTPDLWPGIASRLGAIDAGVAAGGEASTPGGTGLSILRAWLRPLAAGALVAAAATAWLVLSAPTETATGGVVRWIYTKGKPVMVLEGGEDATIIWLLDEAPGEQTGRRRAGEYI